MTYIPQIAALLIAVLFLIRVFNLIVLMGWYRSPRPPGKALDVNGRRVYASLKGEGTPTVIIEAALGAVSPEWWMIQDELAVHTKVLTYDRSGYGWSEVVDEPRTSEAIASELKELIDTLGISAPLVLVGHSLGGLYMNHFARIYPELVGGVVFIDPVSPDNDRFRKELPPLLFQRSGVDKARGIKLLMWFNGFGFTRLMKKAVLKSYSPDGKVQVPSETLNTLWHHLLLPQGPKTALAEYVTQQRMASRSDLKSPLGFPQVPLRVITHGSDRMVERIVHDGKLSVENARFVETLWQELIRSHTALTSGSRLVVAERSGHNVHLDEPELVIKTIFELVEDVRKSQKRRD